MTMSLFLIRQVRRLRSITVWIWIAAAQAQTLTLPPNLIGLDSPQGRAWLLESAAREAYWPLSLQFVTQKDPSYCGVASIVMVLNALGRHAPPAMGFEGFRAYTQDNLFNAATEAILSREVLARQGMTLDQLGHLFDALGVHAEVHHANESSAAQFRKQAAAALATPGQHVVVNYLRAAIGQQAGGHISPLAAYDARADRFLVMDVSRYKYPPVWVSTIELFDAMNSIDAGNDGQRRGYVLVRERPADPRQTTPLTAGGSRG